MPVTCCVGVTLGMAAQKPQKHSNFLAMSCGVGVPCLWALCFPVGPCIGRPLPPVLIYSLVSLNGEGGFRFTETTGFPGALKVRFALWDPLILPSPHHGGDNVLSLAAYWLAGFPGSFFCLTHSMMPAGFPFDSG